MTRQSNNDARQSILAIGVNRRSVLKWAATLGLGGSALAALNSSGWVSSAAAQDLGCPSPTVRTPPGTPEAKSGKKIGVSVAYLSVPFYANFKAGLADGAAQYGFDYELRDGGSGDLSKELAVIQDFIAAKVDLILLTPSGEGIMPGIKLANDAGIPVIEVNNRAGFQSDKVKVVTYVGADDVEYGRLQGKLLIEFAAGKPTKVGYVQGISGTSPQVNRGKGFNEAIKDHAEITIAGTVTDDFDSAKALAATQDLLTRFPKGQIDVIVMQGPEGVAAADFARKNGRDEVKFILGDYPADVRKAIMDGYVLGTTNQDPYPQAFEGMHMAWLELNGKDADIPKPLNLPLPIITKENAEATAPAWGC